MLKIYLITSFLLISFSSQSKDLTSCFDLQQCRQQMQQLIYQHWSARHSYPGAKVTISSQQDSTGNIQINIVQGSGITAFDTSAKSAVTKALQQLDLSQLTVQEQKKMQHFQFTLSAQ